MSLKAYTYVWENSPAGGTDLLVLLALADFADDVGRCHPSIDKLGKRARKSLRSVQERLKALEAAGLIRIDPQAGPHGTNVYWILGLANTEVGGAEVAGGVQKPAVKRDANLHPNRKEQSGTVKNKPLSPAAQDDVLGQFETVWKSHPKRNGKKLRRVEALAVFRRMSPADQETAVRNSPNYRQACETGLHPAAEDLDRWLNPKNRHFDDWAEPASPQSAFASVHQIRPGTHIPSTDPEYRALIEALAEPPNWEVGQ